MGTLACPIAENLHGNLGPDPGCNGKLARTAGEQARDVQVRFDAVAPVVVQVDAIGFSAAWMLLGHVIEPFDVPSLVLGGEHECFGENLFAAFERGDEPAGAGVQAGGIAVLAR